VITQLLPAEVFTFFLVFARIGAAIMFMPGIGDMYVPARFRLIFAGGLTLLLTPILAGTLPAMPNSPMLLAVILFGEITVGAFLGLIGRIIHSALHTAGTVISFQVGLANAMAFDPVVAEQSAVTAQFLTIAGILIIFATDLHHVMLMALASSYNVFIPGVAPPMDDFSQVITRLVGDTFILGVQLATPFIVVGLVFYLGIGVLARLMPQVQVFFIAMPIQIFLGFVVLALTVGAILAWFADRFPDFYTHALGG